MGKSYYKYLDLIRTIALFLVLYGHLITVTTYAVSIPEAFPNEVDGTFLPLLPMESHSMHRLENVFLKFGTQSAVVGVCIFLLLSGYLSVNSRRNAISGKGFFIKRCKRIFPVLWVVVLLSVFLIFCIHGAKYPLIQVISQCFMLDQILGVPSIMGVTWTLGVELLFYVILIHFSKLNYKFITIYNVVITMAIYLYSCTESAVLSIFIYFGKFIPIVLIGAALKIAEEDHIFWRKASFVIFSIVSAWGILKLNAYLNTDESTYPNTGTCMVMLCVFGSIYFAHLFINNFDRYIPNIVTYFSKISYSLYLIQVAWGCNLMYVLKKYMTNNAYTIVAVTLPCLFAASYLLWRFVERPLQKFHLKME